MRLPNISRPLWLALLCCFMLVLGTTLACGGGEDLAETDEQAAGEAAPAADPPEAPPSDAPRVFFTNLREGEELTSPMTLEFGVENFEIVAAQDPPVVEEGKGHHHLGVNTHCLPPGTVIEKADPWVHFGDGSNSIDLQLPPGDHHLSLQVGDGEHRTLDEEGLCAMVNLTVIQEGV